MIRGWRRNTGGWRRAGSLVCAAGVLFAALRAEARDPDPALRIPLAPLGYQGMPSEFLLSGGSMLTLHFVDERHLLVTFNVRRLMKREVADPIDDEDRTVAAYLVEIASGKVIAKTDWRTHDHGQYLWSLGHGRFLLRVRDRLTMFAPMAGNPAEAFREVPFLHFTRHILAILVSATSDLLTIESTAPGETEAAVRPHFGGVPAEKANPIQINFYRLLSEGAGLERLAVVSAGMVPARVPLALPLNSAGFLDVLEGGRNRWLFDFHTYEGKVTELAELETACYPRTTFVTEGEFVAFGCRGSADKQSFAGFNLKGEEMWQQKFYDTHTMPTFAFAPAAGRFALERTVVGPTTDPAVPVQPADLRSQEVRVYQMYSGKVLFRTECVPIVLAGQNFAMSEDGMRVAVVRETSLLHSATKFADEYTSHVGAVEIYDLPALSKKDEWEEKSARALAPPASMERVDLGLRRGAGKPAEPKVDANPAPASAVMTAAALTDAEEIPAPEETAAKKTEVSGAASGDVAPEGKRKPPSLYGPGETPDGKPPR